MRESVAAVLLAGDVVDKEDDFFEAYRELRAGVERLEQAGVQVIGVAGNHDVEVLPRLRDQLDTFTLLGAGGCWECCEVGTGADAATIWGWSFPEPQVNFNPLDGQTFARQSGVNIGLLHCDRGAPRDSPYAPVPPAALQDAGLDAWLLGHIHKPDALGTAPPIGYLGSLCGLSRGETGARGPWLLTIEGGHIASMEQQPLAPLRWQPLDVDVSDIAEPAHAKDRVLECLQRFDAAFAGTRHAPEAVAVALHFTGRTRFGGALAQVLSAEDRGTVHIGAGGRHYFIESLRIDTRPELDLAELAQGSDPPGLLAQRLLALERQGDPAAERLIAQARERLAEQAAKPVWNFPDAGLPAIADARHYLLDAGYRALDRLLAQNQAAD